MQQDIILNHEQIQHKIKRIAYQIYETNVNETEIILAGIADKGYILAVRLQQELHSISDIKIHLCKITMDKKEPFGTVQTSLTKTEYTNKSIVLVDDVLNTGTSLMYGVNHFLSVPVKRFKTAVLVNRNHKKYPVKADFKGVSLSTSLNDHIEVSFGKIDMVSLT